MKMLVFLMTSHGYQVGQTIVDWLVEKAMTSYGWCDWPFYFGQENVDFNGFI